MVAQWLESASRPQAELAAELMHLQPSCDSAETDDEIPAQVQEALGRFGYSAVDVLPWHEVVGMLVTLFSLFDWQLSLVRSGAMCSFQGAHLSHQVGLICVIQVRLTSLSLCIVV